MASDRTPDKPATADRHVYGPRPLAALVPGLVRPALKRNARATAPIALDWEMIVGPAIAAVTQPRKLFGGTLSIACAGPIALELQHLSDQVMARINTHLGRVAVTRLRFMQEPLPVARATPAAFRPPPPAAAMEGARRAVASVPEGALRDALEALGRAVLARDNSRKE